VRAIAGRIFPFAAIIIATATACSNAPARPAQTPPAQTQTALAAHSATIDGGTTYQTIAGFGISEAFGQAATVRDAAPATSKRILDYLFSATAGAGLTILRNEISADPGDTIEPAAPSSPDATPRYLPLSATGSDQGQLWLAQTVKAQYGVTDVIADAWSPPAFMKNNHSTSGGGTLCGVPGVPGVPGAACASG